VIICLYLKNLPENYHVERGGLIIYFFENRFSANLPETAHRGLTSLDGVISLIVMMPEKDMMQFSNLDRVCLNLLAYKWMQVGPPGTLAVDQITDCFSDIPKTHLQKTLAALHEKGFIFFEPNSINVSLTRKGFEHIRGVLNEPICSNARSAVQYF
jgi:hypothetical protein